MCNKTTILLNYLKQTKNTNLVLIYQKVFIKIHNVLIQFNLISFKYSLISVLQS